jgi:hypothetical protein
MNKSEWKSREVGKPQPGYFMTRLVRGGPLVTARIVHGEDGLWSAVIDERAYPPALDPAAAAQVFPIWLSAEAITEADYFRAIKRKRDQLAADPSHPCGRPRQPIDLTKLKPIEV